MGDVGAAVGMARVEGCPSHGVEDGRETRKGETAFDYTHVMAEGFEHWRRSAVDDLQGGSGRLLEEGLSVVFV